MERLKPKSNYIPPEQFQILVDNVNLLSPRIMKVEDIQMLFKITRYCGLRISEATSLTAEDIDTELKEVIIKRSKTKWHFCKCAKTKTRKSFRRERKVMISCDENCTRCNGKGKVHEPDKTSIPPDFIPELDEYLKGKTGRLFNTNRFTVHYWLKVLGKRLNITALTTPQSETHEKTKCHIFRKSIGKDMLYQGLKLNEVSAKLRHNDLTTTSDYLKLKLEDVKLAEEGFSTKG